MGTKKAKTNIMIAVVSVLIVAVVVGAVFLVKYINSNGNESAREINKIDIDPNQHEYQIPEDIKDHTKNIILPGWAAFTISKNTTDIKKGIDFYNPDGNFWYSCSECGSQLDDNYKCVNEKCGKQCDDTYNDCYYMTFKLVLEEGDEVLYESGLVEPGMHIQNIKLTRALSEGDYDAYVFIQPYASDRSTALNNGKVNIKLYVR